MKRLVLLISLAMLISVLGYLAFSQCQTGGTTIFTKVGNAGVGAQNRILAAPNGNLYASGRLSGGAAVSTNGGTTWTPLNNKVGGGTILPCVDQLGLNNLGEVISSNPFVSSQTGCGTPHMLRLVGNGNAWTVEPVPNSLPSQFTGGGKARTTKGNVVLAGSGGGIPWYSTDNGSTWNIHASGLAVGACGERLASAVNANGTISISVATCTPAWSTDGGVNWHSWTQPYVPPPPSTADNWVSLLGNDDLLLSYTSGNHTWCLRGGSPDVNNSALVRCDTGLPAGRTYIPATLVNNLTNTKTIAAVFQTTTVASTMFQTLDNANTWTAIPNNGGLPSGIFINSMTIDASGFMYMIDFNTADIYKTTQPQ